MTSPLPIPRHRPAVSARRALRAALAAAALGAALLPGCFDDRAAVGPSPDAGPPTVRGTVTDTSGAPAAAARVALLRLPPGSGDSALLAPPRPVDTLVAGADGTYRFDSLPAGEYTLEGFDAARTGFGRVRNLSIQPGRVENGDMVLRAPARLRGTARRAGEGRIPGIPGDAGIRVRVGGLNRFADTDSLGRWEIAEVPPGEYDLAFAALDGLSLPAFRAGLRAEPGATLEVEPEVELAGRSFLAPPSAPKEPAVR